MLVKVKKKFFLTTHTHNKNIETVKNDYWKKNHPGKRIFFKKAKIKKMRGKTTLNTFEHHRHQKGSQNAAQTARVTRDKCMT